MSAAPEHARSERIADAGEFALGLLEGAAHRAAEARLASDTEFEATVLGWQRDLAPLNACASEVMPDPRLWSRIEAGIGTAGALREAQVTIPSPMDFLDRLWHSLVLWRRIGFGGAFASLLFAAMFAVRIAAGPAVPQLVAVLNAPDGRAAAIVNAYADGTVQLVPLDPLVAPEGRVLEVWTLQRREQGPVSLARMDKARTVKLDLRGLSPAEVGHLFEITLEPAGGSPTGKPTGPVLMKGLAATRL